MNFNVGDRVYRSGWGMGVITYVSPEDKEAVVQFETHNGGGSFPFSFDELRYVPEKKGIKDIKDMSNYELGTIAKAFAECEDCVNCPCDGMLCGNNGWDERKTFILEVAKRLMNT